MTLSLTKQSTDYLLGPDGPLAKAIDGYQVRQAQLDLANDITDTLANNKLLIAEAGTGIGKSFAYLVPALLANKKILISTGTKNLQDQLYVKDIPLLSSIIVTGAIVTILKGRSNYLCWYRLQNNAIDARFDEPQAVADYQQVQTWSDRTRHGDISEITGVAEDSVVWPMVTSTADNCLGSECDFYQDCFLVKARREAQTADVVIINHHLFFADFALSQEQFSELLPSVDAVIFDEAHQLPAIASEFFGTRISARQIQELCRDTVAEAKSLANDMPDVVNLIAQIQMRLLDMRYAMSRDPKRGTWHSICENKDVCQAVDILQSHLTDLNTQLELYAGRSAGLERCFARSVTIAERFNEVTTQTPKQQIHWYETFNKSFSIHHTPMSIANQFRSYVEQQGKAFVFTSATLTVANQFNHFQQAMGLEQAPTAQYQSPFNYREQAVLYLPRYLPAPNAENYVRTLMARALPLIKAAGGSTFLLFTSYRNMHAAAELMKDCDFPVLVQGTMAKSQLLQAFKQAGNAVLFATHSFWEGVDVRGDALRCVVIDKLPFAAPDDPILQARIHNLKRQGQDPFQQHQLPKAIIELRQGVGRLIRDQQDKGVIMLADPRIATKAYGAAILASLPKMSLTRDQQRATEFLEALHVCDHPST